MKPITVPRPPQLEDWDAGRMDAWLTGKGIDARVDVNGDGTVTIKAADDADEAAIRQLIETYVKEETPREKFEREAIADAVQLVKQIAQIPAAQRTVQQRIALGMALAIQNLKQDIS